MTCGPLSFLGHCGTATRGITDVETLSVDACSKLVFRRRYAALHIPQSGADEYPVISVSWVLLTWLHRLLEDATELDLRVETDPATDFVIGRSDAVSCAPGRSCYSQRSLSLEA